MTFFEKKNKNKVATFNQNWKKVLHLEQSNEATLVDFSGKASIAIFAKQGKMHNFVARVIKLPVLPWQKHVAKKEKEYPLPRKQVLNAS